MPISAAANSAGVSAVAPLRRGEAAVEQRLHQRRKQRLGRGRADHADHREREHLRVRPHVAEQPQVQLAALLAQVGHRQRVPLPPGWGSESGGRALIRSESMRLK